MPLQGLLAQRIRARMAQRRGVEAEFAHLARHSVVVCACVLLDKQSGYNSHQLIKMWPLQQAEAWPGTEAGMSSPWVPCDGTEGCWMRRRKLAGHPSCKCCRGPEVEVEMALRVELEDSEPRSAVAL